MDKEILKHYYDEGKKFGYALARDATDLPSVQTFDELYTAQLQQHGVGGPASASALEGEQCRPEAWAVRGKASMPEAPLSGAALPPMYPEFMQAATFT